MDPFAALGVAAAAVQFFDFTRSLFKEYSERKDQSNIITSTTFDNVAKDLKVYVDVLKDHSSDTGQSSISSIHEKALRDLASDCSKVADTLLKLTVKLQPKAKKAKWKSFTQAIRTVLSAEELAKYQQQLDLYRNQIVVRSLSCLNEKMEESVRQTNQQTDTIRHSKEEIIGVIAYYHRELRDAILSYGDGHVQTIRRHDYEQKEAPPSPGSPATSHDDIPRSIMYIEAASQETDPRAGIQDFSDISKRVLDCLHFRQIVDRYESVKEAHGETFQWVFRDPKEHGKSWSNLPEWLEQSDGCYWIQGKAASGKSTLTKRIKEDPRTAKHLKKWAGNRTLLTSSFFFWYLGTPLQKSQEGLLRTLLHSILREIPRLIGEIMPDLCTEATKLRAGELLQSPNLDELTRWFSALTRALENDDAYRVCLFVDGLDEYVGDHFDLAKFFLDISRSTQALKFVLSSRPIDACADAFSHLPGLSLQELTRNDMREYVIDLLGDKSTSISREEADGLINELVNKSSGVFLWVCLAVKSLLEGLRAGDTISELQNRLNEMPTELSDLYRHMLKRIPSKYQVQASEILQLTAANFCGYGRSIESNFFTPLTALQLSYAMHDARDILASNLMGNSARGSMDDARRRVAQVEKRIRSRCLGFLELHYYPQTQLQHEQNPFRYPTVHLVHRTLLDFLSHGEILDLLRKQTEGTGFDPYHGLFASSLLMVRTCPSIDTTRSSGDEPSPWDFVQPTLLMAYDAEISQRHFPQAYLDAFNDSLQSHWIVTATVMQGRNGHLAKTNGHWSQWVFLHGRHYPSVQNQLVLLRKDNPNRGNNQHNYYPRNKHALPLPLIAMDERLHEKLNKDTGKLGFAFIAMLFALTTYVEESVTSGLKNGQFVTQDVTHLLNFLVHEIAFIEPTNMRETTFDWLSEEICALFKCLLDHGADSNYQAYDNYTIWELFIVSVQWDIERGGLSFIHAAELDNLDGIVTAFISHGADLKVKVLYGDELYGPAELLRTGLLRLDYTVSQPLQKVIKTLETSRQGQTNKGSHKRRGGALGKLLNKLFV